MKNFININIFILFFTLTFGCAPKNQVTTKDANKQITSRGLEGSWALVRIKDSYDGAWKDASDSGMVISFSSEGRYSEKDKANGPCEGKFSKQEKQLLVTHSCNTSELSYTLEEVTAEKLTLSIRGRHGAVYHEYSRIIR